MPAEVPLLELQGIEKRFGEVVANSHVDLTLRPGEVLGLLGENGAGKTTLMNVLFGLYQADAGRIRVAGRPVAIRSPADALALGIGMVHQHAHVVARHSVLENLMIGLPGKRGLLDRRSATRRLREIGESYGLVLDPDRLVADLGVGERQRLEIVKSLFRGARVLILDEPTSVLTPQQMEGLFQAIRAMTADGVGVIFISHKLNEVRAITHRVVIMRRGAVVAALDNDGTLANTQLASLMCGQELTPPQKAAHTPGAVMLQMRGVRLATAGGGAAMEFALRAGEIVGLAGVSGNGQLQLAETLAGVRRPLAGEIILAGQPVRDGSPRRMRQLGLAYIPEDRLGAGLIGTLPLRDSMVLPRLHQRPFSRFGWIDHRRVQAFVDEQIGVYDIRPADAAMRTGLFSGGNQQKAIVARELPFDPRILVIAYPTRGLDVAASEFVHRKLLDLRSRGCAILAISDDLEEIFALADRIAVICEGAIMLDLPAATATVAQIGLAMSGGGSPPVPPDIAIPAG